MARIRSLYPEFFESDDTSTLSPLAALTYAGLWVISDDEGRGRLSAGFIHHRLHARRPGISEADTSAALKELADSKLIVAYAHPTLYHIPSFKKHQRPRFPTPSKLPPPPNATVTLHEGNGNAAGVLGDVDIDIDLGVDLDADVDLELGERSRRVVVGDARQPSPPYMSARDETLRQLFQLAQSQKIAATPSTLRARLDAWVARLGAADVQAKLMDRSSVGLTVNELQDAWFPKVVRKAVAPAPKSFKCGTCQDTKHVTDPRDGSKSACSCTRARSLG